LLKRVLLDECVPKRLGLDLFGHDVETVPGMGWAGIKNGQLLQKAASEFDCFLTVDRNLQFQQSHALPIAVLVVAAKDNKLATLKAMAPNILTALSSMKPRDLKVVGV
jgi:hypothetical protein